MWFIYTIEYYSDVKKEWNLAICDNMDESRGYYAKWNKSDSERQILYDLTYMRNIKQTNKLIGTENRLVVAWSRKCGMGKMGEKGVVRGYKLPVIK